MPPIVLFRQGGLGITENDPFTYPVDDPAEPQRIKITTDEVKIFFPVEVQRVKHDPKDQLHRVVTDGVGNHYNFQLPPFCPTNRDELSRSFGQFLDNHAEDFVVEQGPWCRQLVQLYRSSDNAHLSSAIRLLFIGIWKTGSGYLSPETPLGIKPLPADSQTTPSRIPIPRYIIHCTDSVADVLGMEYTTEVVRVFESLRREIDVTKAHLAYVLLGAIYNISKKIVDDFERRKGQKAPGTEGSGLADQIDESLAYLSDLLRTTMNGASISFKDLTTFHFKWSYDRGENPAPLPELKSFGIADGPAT
ncbi:hypothetical protein LQW54_010662 [Pestalotiopsis sp. IQ-011]